MDTNLTQTTTSILAELGEFLRAVRSWLYAWLLGTAVLFGVGFQSVVWKGYTFVVPDQTAAPLAALMLQHMTERFVPEGVTLVALTPFAAFVAQLVIALVLAFIISLPIFVLRLFAYLFPALYRHERRALLVLCAIAALLFAGGSVFGYLIIIPTTLHFLYGYVAWVGAVPFFSVTELVGIVLSFTLVTGLCFLLPVVMVLLSLLGAVSRTFWWREWRMALLLFLMVSAILTPDGSGVSMVLLAAPLSLLYVAGASVSTYAGRTAPSSLST